MKKIAWIILMGLLGVSAQSAILSTDWDSAGLEGWTSTNALGAGTGFGVLSNPGTSLQITSGNPLGQPYVDYISAKADLGNPGAENINYPGLGIQSVSMNFTADANAGGGTSGDLPSDLRFYFVSDISGSDRFWYYPITSTAGTGLYGANFVFGTWYTAGPGSTEANFLMDLASVDDVGILLGYQALAAGQVYGIDNFALDVWIPEPETYLMLAFAVLSLAIVFRRELNDSWLALCAAQK